MSNDLMLEYLVAKGADHTALPDAWSEFLDLERVAAGPLNKRQLAWLKGRGATADNLPDAWKQFLSSYALPTNTVSDSRRKWIIEDTTGIPAILTNSPQLALGLQPFEGYSGVIARVRRVIAADEVDVFDFRDIGGFYKTPAGWEDSTGETFRLVEWYSQFGSNFGKQTVQADQPAIVWEDGKGWFLDLQGVAGSGSLVGQYMETDSIFQPQSMFMNFQDTVQNSGFHGTTGAIEGLTSAHSYVFLQAFTSYYISLDGAAGNQGYVYRNNGAKLGPGENIGGSESVTENQVISVGMTSAADMDSDLIFACGLNNQAGPTCRPYMKVRSLITYPTVLDEATTRLEIHNGLMTKYGI